MRQSLDCDTRVSINQHSCSLLMKVPTTQNEKHRICISSRDLNYARNDLCTSIKMTYFAEIQQMFLLYFIFESIVFTHII